MRMAAFRSKRIYGGEVAKPAACRKSPTSLRDRARGRQPRRRLSARRPTTAALLTRKGTTYRSTSSPCTKPAPPSRTPCSSPATSQCKTAASTRSLCSAKCKARPLVMTKKRSTLAEAPGRHRLHHARPLQPQVDLRCAGGDAGALPPDGSSPTPCCWPTASRSSPATSSMGRRRRGALEPRDQQHPAHGADAVPGQWLDLLPALRRPPVSA